MPVTPDASYDETQILEGSPSRLPTEEPNHQVTVSYQRNWSPLTVEQIASVADADKVFLSTEWRKVTASNESVFVAYPLSKSIEFDSIFDDQAAALDEANRQLALFGARRDYFSVRLKVQPLGIEVSAAVAITHPRYGLTEGKVFRLVDLTEDMDAFEVELGLWG